MRLLRSAYPCMGGKFPGIDFAVRCEKPCGYCGVREQQTDDVLASGMRNILIELRSGKYSGVYLSPNTDAFSRGSSVLAHVLLEQILPQGLIALINTKQGIPDETLELLRKHRNSVIVQVSIPTLDERLSEIFEPGAAAIDSRLRMVRRLTDLDISATVLIMPWLDLDSDIARLPKAIAAAGAKRCIAAFGVFTLDTLSKMMKSGYHPLVQAAEKMTERVRILIGGGLTLPYEKRADAYLRLARTCSDVGIKARVCGVALNPDLIGNKVGVPMCTQIRHPQLRE